MNIKDQPKTRMFWVFENQRGAVVCMEISQKQFDKMAGSPGLSFLHLEGAIYAHDVLYGYGLSDQDAYLAVDQHLFKELQGA